MTVSADYKRKIFAVRTLPTLPIIAQKILRLRGDDEFLAEKLRHVISRDQSLSVKVLTLANSAYFGHRAQVGTIKKAVVVIGTAMLRQFVLGITVGKKLGQGGGDRELIWHHSLMAATAASDIAKAIRIANVEGCFMAGLLHDVGKLVLDTNVPEEYARVAEMVKEENYSLIEAERLTFDTDHAAVGAWMAERWQLPAELVQAIGFHHDQNPSSLAHARIVAVAHAASVCAEAAQLMNDEIPETPQISLPPEVQSLLGMSDVQIVEIVEGLHRRKSEIQLLFGQI